VPSRKPHTGYDFVFAPDPGRLYRVIAAKAVFRLYRLDGQRWLFERAVPLGVVERWRAHAMPEAKARAYQSLPVISEV
jgi:hypothetical protein